MDFMDASVQAAVRASFLLEGEAFVPAVLRPVLEELVRDVMAAAVEEATEAGVRRVRLLNTAAPDINSNMPVLQRATFTTFLPQEPPQHNPLLYVVE